MQIVLQQNELFKEKEPFYTDEELHLLELLESGVVKTKSHDEVMENLRKVLTLDEV